MKWVAFLILVAAVPVLAQYFRSSPKRMGLVWSIFGFLPFALTVSPLFDIGIISWPFWSGFTTGIDFSLLDAIAIAILFSKREKFSALPYKGNMAFYFAIVVFSIFMANAWMASAFFAWQCIRVFLVFTAVSLAINDEKSVVAILRGMAIGVALQAVMVIYQRYGLYMTQTTGTFIHQNTLGMATNFFTIPAFALLLAKKGGWVPIIGCISGAIVSVYATSRGAIGFAAMGLAAVYALSLLRGITTRKLSVAAAGIVAIGILAPIALNSFNQRFEENPLNKEYNERAAFELAARNMANNNPFGVGANNFVVVANLEGYYENAGVVYTNRAAVVHNFYWATAAEIGYLGLLATILLLARPVLTAKKLALRHKKDMRTELIMGLGISLIAVYGHNFFEWVFATSTIQYFYAINCGLIVSLTRQVRKDYTPNKSSDAPEPIETEQGLKAA